MLVFDAVVLVFIVISTFLSISRGLAKELFLVLAWITAGVATYYLYQPSIGLLSEYIGTSKFAIITVTALIFMLVLAFTSYLLSEVLMPSSRVALGITDTTAGAIFGAIRGVLLLAVLVHLLNLLVPQDSIPAWIENSISKPVLSRIGQELHEALPDTAQDWLVSLSI